MPDRLTTAYINLANYQHNLTQIRENLDDDVHIMAVVKANAYGHGIEQIAQAAVEAGASHIGVASVGELKRIRRAGITTPILILNYVDADSLKEVICSQGSITVMDESIIKAAQLAARKTDYHLNVHLKIDTGMHRAGCEPEEALNLAKYIQTSSHLELQGIFTHLAEADALDNQFTSQQLGVFRECLDNLRQQGINPELVHCANSAATIASPDTHFTMVRPGLITYGLNPFDSSHPQYNYVAQHFKPVLSLVSKVVHIRRIQSGEAVGYGRHWIAERPSILALLPIGYGDGWRRAPNANQVLVHGQYAPIVGSISMDQTVIDITDIPGVSIDDEVVLLGAQASRIITADDIAAQYGTINYEVVAALTDRVVRLYN